MTRRLASTIAASLPLLLPPAVLAGSGVPSCAPDMVAVGSICVDRYEASVWYVGTANKGLVKKIRQGKAVLADLQSAGAVQLGTYGPSPAPPPPALHWPTHGDWTPEPGSDPPSPGVYALSIAGAPPSLSSWFQASQACALSGRRLLTVAEWQRAASGTPDPGPVGGGDPASCNHFFDWPPYAAGAHTKCVSNWGAFDMVGNFGEWTADVVNAWDFEASQQPPQHALILGIAGAGSLEPRYFVDDVSDGIGFRCGR